MRTIPVIGLPVAVTDYAGAVGWILDKAKAPDRAYAVEAANTHVAAMARTDPAFGRAMERFDLICPDGMPLIWSLNFGLRPAERLRDRVYGPTLMLKCFEATQTRPREFRHFLLGGTPQTLSKLGCNLARKFPGCSIAGTYSPPFTEWTDEEFDKISAEIRDTGSNIVWVALGCPKQEQWLANHKERLPPAVYLAVGAAFAFHAGEIRQAPGFLQRSGLEWAFRAAMEPRRLLRRYVVYNSLFVYHSVRDMLRD